MAFCPQCGAPGSGRFCAQCGAALPESGEAPPPVLDPVPPPASLNAPGMRDNVAAALCYLLGLVTGILFLVLAPYNQSRVVRFHAWQSILTHAVFLVLFLVVLPLLPWPPPPASARCSASAGLCCGWS